MKICDILFMLGTENKQSRHSINDSKLTKQQEKYTNPTNTQIYSIRLYLYLYLLHVNEKSTRTEKMQFSCRSRRATESKEEKKEFKQNEEDTTQSTNNI